MADSETNNPRPPDEPIRSYAEYRARYFPEQVERERLAALTPEELGREWAERALDMTRKVEK